MSEALPFLVSAFGILLSVLLGMAVNKLTAIERKLENVDGRLFSHLTHAGVHESGFAKVEEQIKTLYQTIKVAHERLDRLTQVRT